MRERFENFKEFLNEVLKFEKGETVYIDLHFLNDGSGIGIYNKDKGLCISFDDNGGSFEVWKTRVCLMEMLCFELGLNYETCYER